MKIFFAFFTSLFIASFAVADSLTCHDEVENIITAVFQPISYTCDAGYFLPAHTTGCRPCPNGYTCAGGTFDFNESIAQGLVRKESNIVYNQNNVCDINTSRYMSAVFVSNENNDIVNITWNNDGETNTTNCVYGDTISLPPTPTRVGYTFTGWKVKTND